jgi:translation elongation factor EF-Tu-like GTPase
VDKPFRARVLASSDVAGRGTVAIVEVRAGTIRTGRRVAIGELRRPAEVTAVEVFAQDEEERAEGALPQLGLLLAGIDRSIVPRGCELITEEVG